MAQVILALSLLFVTIIINTDPCLCSPLSSSSLNNLARASNPLKDIRDVTFMLVQEYSRYLLSLIESVQKVQNNIRRHTYTYGLEVVGRPIDQLSPPEMLLSAALMPGKFYNEATSNFVKKLSALQKALRLGIDVAEKAQRSSQTLYKFLQTIPRDG